MRRGLPWGVLALLTGVGQAWGDAPFRECRGQRPMVCTAQACAPEELHAHLSMEATGRLTLCIGEGCYQGRGPGPEQAEFWFTGQREGDGSERFAALLTRAGSGATLQWSDGHRGATLFLECR